MATLIGEIRKKQREFFPDERKRRNGRRFTERHPEAVKITKQTEETRQKRTGLLTTHIKTLNPKKCVVCGAGKPRIDFQRTLWLIDSQRIARDALGTSTSPTTLN